MGFSTIIDIIGSTIVGGFLLLILLRMNDSAVKNNYDFSGEKIVQTNLVELVELLEYDFRKIGYCADYSQIDPPKAIIQANDTSITFLTDIVTSAGTYGDGVVDTLRYYIGSNAGLSSTPNPNDKILYRRVNNETPKGSNLGVTQFKLTYFDALGDTIPDATLLSRQTQHLELGIASMQIDITLENPYAYGDDYSADKRVIWRQIRLAARNFTTR